MKTGLAFVLALILALIGCAATSNTGSSGGSRKLKSLQVTAPSASVAAGLTLQLTATGTYSDGSTQDLTSSVSWSTSAPSIATIGSGGLLTAKATGPVTVTADSGSVMGANNVTVGSAIVASLSTINPSNSRIAANTKEQLHAIAVMTDGSLRDVTDLVTWTTFGSAASITNNIPKGIVKAGTPSSPTSITVTATCGSGCPAKSGRPSTSTSLTVTNALATGIEVSPSGRTIGWGTQLQLTAMGIFDDGSSQDITISCNWKSSNPNIVFIASGSGLAVAKGVGSTTVQASFESITSNTTPLTVDLSNLRSISVSPANAMIAEGTQFGLAAIGTFLDGSTRNLAISNAVAWSSGDTSIAAIGASSGLAQGVGKGSSSTTAITATVSAGSNTISGSTSLDVENATLQSIAVGPATASIPINGQIAFTAVGTFNGSTCGCQFQQTITGQTSTTWKSTSAVVSMDGSGIATAGQSAGTTSITASSSLTPGSVVSNSASLTVNSVWLTSISVTPSSTFIPPGATVLYKATGYYSDNATTQNLTQQVTWSSSSGTVASVNGWGLATGQGQGNANITATCSNSTSCNPGGNTVSASANLRVTPASLVSITISPANPMIAAGTASQLTATGHFSDTSTQDLTGSVDWSSSSKEVATVGAQNGILSAGSPGQTDVTATFGSVTSPPTLVTVASATLQKIVVSPNAATVNLGGSQIFNATGYFSNGTVSWTQNLLNETWNSTPTSVAIMSNYGLATSSGQTGTATISATLKGVTGTAYLTVQ